MALLRSAPAWLLRPLHGGVAAALAVAPVNQSSPSRAVQHCMPVHSALKTATDGTRRELEPTSNVAISFFGVRLTNRVSERPITSNGASHGRTTEKFIPNAEDIKSARYVVPPAKLRIVASSPHREKRQAWAAAALVRGRTGAEGAGGPVVAGDPRGGWPPADTGIVLPEYSTPRYRDLLPPRLGGRR